MGNYRPISILSTFSKILEKLIYNRTQSFLEKHSITLPTQYGCRPAYSTSHAMIDILTSTLDNINVNKNTALLLLDLKKAFDTMNHDQWWASYFLKVTSYKLQLLGKKSN